jgi:hypothetical protein
VILDDRGDSHRNAVAKAIKELTVVNLCDKIIVSEKRCKTVCYDFAIKERFLELLSNLVNGHMRSYQVSGNGFSSTSIIITVIMDNVLWILVPFVVWSDLSAVHWNFRIQYNRSEHTKVLQALAPLT